MLTETVQPQPENTPNTAHGNGSNSETDLGALAEHLSVIADALRKTTQGSPHKNQSEDRNGTSALVEASSNVAKAVAAYASTPAASPPPDVQHDAKMRRRRFSALAREAYAVRRRRAVLFKSEDLFGEPAWDILLDLYIAHTEGKLVSVSSACIGSAAPPTTGLRWLGVLSDHGLILREHDPEDQRRVLVRLTEKGLSAMDEYFASLGRSA